MAPKGGAVVLPILVDELCWSWYVRSRSCMAWKEVAAVGLKPPPRELVVTAGQFAGSGRKRKVLTGQPSSAAARPADGVDVVETRTCQVRVSMVAVAMAGRVSRRELSMQGRSRVMLVVLVDWGAGPFDIDSWYGMTCERFTAVGLKPPLREHVVVSGRMAAGART